MTLGKKYMTVFYCWFECFENTVLQIYSELLADSLWQTWLSPTGRRVIFLQLFFFLRREFKIYAYYLIIYFKKTTWV